MSDTRQGSTTSYQQGSLKRRLPSVILAHLTSSVVNEGDDHQFRLRLNNLNQYMSVQIAAAYVGNKTEEPIKAADVVNNAVTYQLTPVNNFTDTGPVWLRPLFQDPAGAPNENHPLPQSLPHSWEFSTNADMVFIDLDLTSAAFAATDLDGRVVVQVTIEYNGSNTYFDLRTMSFGISQVQLTGNDPVSVGTQTPG